MIMDFDALVHSLKGRLVYIIHEENRETETRDFAERLKQAGVHPLVAADYRQKGKKAVEAAIKAAQVSLVVAFDDETVKWAEKRGIPFFEMEIES